MGLIDSVKDAVGMGDDSSSSDDIASGFEEGEQLEESIEDTVDREEEEEQSRTWENAYRFAEDMLEQDGHADMMEFTKKAMFHEIETSPRYRNRIEQGVETIEKIGNAREQLRKISGEDNTKDYRERAEELSEVNELMDEIDSLQGRDDQIVREALNVGRDLADGMLKNATEATGSVNSEVREGEGSIEE